MRLLTEAHQHTTRGPAAALHIAALAASVVACLSHQVPYSSSSSNNGRAFEICGGGGGEGERECSDISDAVRCVVGWLADVTADITAQEPPARWAPRAHTEAEHAKNSLRVIHVLMVMLM